MNSSPHPNQVRSACQRCRHRKLRCSGRSVSRGDTFVALCTRCERLGLDCIAGVQGRVGRPSKRSVVAVRKRLATHASACSTSSESNPAPALDVPETLTGFETREAVFSGQLTESLHFEDDASPAGATASLDWAIDTPGSGSPFMLPLDDSAILPFAETPSLSEIPPLGPEVSFTVGTPNPDFSALSRINVRLHATWETYGRFAKDVTLEALIHGLCEDSPTSSMHGLRVLLEVTQDYLRIIKSLHRTISTALPQELSTILGDTFFTRDDNMSELTLDSPTAFLVISCFSQITRLLEITYTVLNARMSNPKGHAVSPGTMSLADVAIVDFPSQVAMVTELMRHLFRQMIIILGLPGASWPGNVTWTGLVAPDRYREMLNADLGAVEGLWSTKPARVIQMMDASNDLSLLQAISVYS